MHNGAGFAPKECDGLITWSKRESAWVGATALTDARRITVIVMGDSENANGVVCLLPQTAPDAAPAPTPLPQVQSLMEPEDVMAILSMQERAFGPNGWPAPTAT